jgi:hypothetical protein
MKNLNGMPGLKPLRPTVQSLAVLAAMFVPLALFLSAGCASETASKAGQPPVQMAAAGSANEQPKNAPRKLSGAELYSMNCNRCHQERYPTERTAAQWRTVLLHMRVRANLPDAQARTILQYLQDNSGR